MPNVNLILFQVILSQIYWVLTVLMILSVWRKNHRSLEGLEMKNEGEKSRTPRYKGLGCRASQSAPTWPPKFGAWRLTPLIDIKGSYFLDYHLS